QVSSSARLSSTARSPRDTPVSTTARARAASWCTSAMVGCADWAARSHSISWALRSTPDADASAPAQRLSWSRKSAATSEEPEVRSSWKASTNGLVEPPVTRSGGGWQPDNGVLACSARKLAGRASHLHRDFAIADEPHIDPMITTVAERVQHELLPRVSKPNRYLGNALHAPHKPLEQALVRVLMAFPDAFEIGLSTIGIRIIHHVPNQRPEVAAELVFAPWPDAEAEMRARGIPLFSMESHAAAADFDVIGFSLQYELQYTNLLAMLDLAGLPLRTTERDARHPLVIAGGAQAFSPEPVAEF